MSAWLWSAAVVLGVFALGWYVGMAMCRAYSRRQIDALLVRRLAELGVAPEAITRAMRAGQVDAAALRYSRRRGRAAYADMFLFGEEVTLVSVDRAYLDRVVAALKHCRPQIERRMREFREVATVEKEEPHHG
jgi:hypothetical protein